MRTPLIIMKNQNTFLKSYPSSMPHSRSFELIRKESKGRDISPGNTLRFNILATESRWEEERLKFYNSLLAIGQIASVCNVLAVERSLKRIIENEVPCSWDEDRGRENPRSVQFGRTAWCNAEELHLVVVR